MKKFFQYQAAEIAIFSLLFVLLCFVFGLQKVLFQPPQSLHIWRQTNSLSIAYNYYQDDLPFFKPEIHNQFSDGGTSGKSVGEFPIIYYIVAGLWQVFGHNEGVFRILHLIIQFLGLFALFQIVKRITKSRIYAGFVSLLIFTSPMVVFFGPNFLPDVPALSFVFIAWYFMFIFLEKRGQGYLWIAALFFCLSMLLKITSALSYIALGGWILYELLFKKREKGVFNFNVKHLIPFVLIIPVVVAWYLYVEVYNKAHGGHFSFHGIWPVWDMSKEQLVRIIDALDKIYFKQMFFPITQYVTVGIWIFLIIVIRKLQPVLRYFIVVMPIGLILQVALWFQVLEGHDYYTINLLVVFAAVWAIFFNQLGKFKLSNSRAMQFIVIIFLGINVFNCKNRIEERYTGWMNDMYENRMSSLTELESTLQRLGIGRDDKVISYPDYTINASLYYMKRKGYTEFGSDLNSVEGIQKRIDDGAGYLIINDTTVLDRTHLQPFVKERVGKYKNILIYDLSALKQKD